VAAKGLGEGVHSGWEFGEEKIEARADKEEEGYYNHFFLFIYHVKLFLPNGLSK